MANVSPSSHEEADTRLILHVTAAINLGKDQIAANSDVLVLCVVLLHTSNSGSNLEQGRICTLSQPVVLLQSWELRSWLRFLDSMHSLGVILCLCLLPVARELRGALGTATQRL